MGTYPTSPRSDFLEWCQVHEPVFSAHAAEIGLSADEALAFKNATDEGATRSLAQEAAKEASKVATQKAATAFATLSENAGKAVRTIRAYAETSPDPDAVYAIAQIPPPAAPSPVPPPGQPTNLTVTLDATEGTITLRWKASNPRGASGTSYIIRRRLPGESGFSFIGVAGTKAFIDNSLIAGPDSVQYTVQGQRGQSIGPVSPIFVVNFGRVVGGIRVATVTSETPSAARWNVEIPAPAGNGNGAGSRRRMADAAY